MWFYFSNQNPRHRSETIDFTVFADVLIQKSQFFHKKIVVFVVASYIKIV